MHEKAHSVWDLASSMRARRMALLRVGTARLKSCIWQLLRQLRLLLEARPEAAGEVGHGHLQLCHLTTQPLVVLLHSISDMSRIAEIPNNFSAPGQHYLKELMHCSRVYCLSSYT